MPFQYILSDGSYGHTPIKYLFHFSTATKKVVLLIDSLSVLQSLASGNSEDYTLRNLIHRLNSLTSRTTAVLPWIPAHTGIHWNEVADQLAKEGSKKQQPKSKLSYQEAKMLIRNKRLADFRHRNGGYKTRIRSPRPRQNCTSKTTEDDK